MHFHKMNISNLSPYGSNGALDALLCNGQRWWVLSPPSAVFQLFISRINTVSRYLKWVCVELQQKMWHVLSAVMTGKKNLSASLIRWNTITKATRAPTFPQCTQNIRGFSIWLGDHKGKPPFSQAKYGALSSSNYNNNHKLQKNGSASRAEPAHEQSAETRFCVAGCMRLLNHDGRVSQWWHCSFNVMLNVILVHGGVTI